MSLLPPEVPGPNPGQPGHFGHHDWLTASVKALDDGTDLVAVLVPTITALTVTGTWAKPVGLVYAVVEVQGAGGGGGGAANGASNQASAGGGGGGGGYGLKVFTAAELLASEPVTVGVGGSAGSGSQAGGNGSGTGFKGMTGLGGAGGQFSGTTGHAGVNGGSGGSATGCTYLVEGSDGTPGRIIGTGSGDPSGNVPAAGGASHMGGSSRPASGNAGGDGIDGQLYGGGGSAGSSRNGSGGAFGGKGAVGIVIITAYVLTWVTAPPRP